MQETLRKVPAPIKIKSAVLPPPKKQNEEFYGHGGFPAERKQKANIPDAHIIGAPISGPRIADKKLTDTRIFLKR